jgi:hypothetical protein
MKIFAFLMAILIPCSVMAIDAGIHDGNLCYKRPSDGAYCCTGFPPAADAKLTCISVSNEGPVITEEDVNPKSGHNDWSDGGVVCRDLHIGLRQCDDDKVYCCSIPMSLDLWCVKKRPVDDFGMVKTKVVKKSEENGHKWVNDRFMPICGTQAEELYLYTVCVK